MIPIIKKYISKAKKWYQKKSIQNMLSIYFTLLSVVGMVLIAVPLYLNFTNTAEHMVEQENKHVIDQTNQFLDTYLRNIMNVSNSVYYQVIKNADLAKDTIVEQLDLLYNTNREQLVSIAIFNLFGKVEAAAPLSNLKENIDPRDEEWFRNAEAQIENLHFSKPHVQNLFNDPDNRYRWVVSMSNDVEITKNGKRENGVLLVDMNFSGIERVCQSANISDSGYVYLMDADGEIIYHPKQQLLYSKLEKESNVEAAGLDDGNHTEIFQGEKRLVTIKTVGYTGWKLVAVTPLTEVVAKYSQIRIFVLFIFCFGLFVLIFVSLLVSARIANPIKRLEKSVKKLEKGDLNVEITASGPYEIMHLGKTVRSMVEQMKKLMDDIVVEQEQKRKSELDALQTQINPHFLYNTLDSVIWMIENERYEGAITMVTSLARLFRISISKGKSIITVKDELEHARNYLTIQSIRYKNKFTYEIQAEEETLQLATMKLIIQPMVENAIYHGMEYMLEDDGGKIVIKSYIRDEDLFIEICDNGIGMAPDVLASLLSREQRVRSRGSGIGMNNVHERICLYFGRDYGVHVESEADEGTRVTIHLPRIPIEEIGQEGGAF
ncbi:sensor histidine kinase [Robinsoniella peoriensis]|uniref:histidine kinase n=1 Tax=Robinsoniella peoriensis TaxID=180332 RepID=A0A4U8QRE7_9FIRM|nr:sensor histidine kinase [Robinsoniella peoriensis]MDU7028158.1 sensor histidine kinase [Clostridiales bacterium]TLD02816.1 Sensor histidine kinase YehU [Robinsoniella peoriensis]